MAAHIVYDGKGVPVNHVSNVGLSLHSSCPINRPCFTQNWNHMDELSETTLEKKNTTLNKLIEWTPPKKKSPTNISRKRVFQNLDHSLQQLLQKISPVLKPPKSTSTPRFPTRIESNISSQKFHRGTPGLRNLWFTVGRSGFLALNPGWISTWWESQDGTTRKANWNDHL